MRAILSGLFALLAMNSAWAQTDEEIVVPGDRRSPERVFTETLSATPFAIDQLARWDQSICPGIIGLRDTETARYLLDRISQRAADVGLRVGAPGCRANLAVFITPDSDRFSQELVANYPRLLGVYADSQITTAGRAQLRDFLETPRPVRWWQVATTHLGDGGPESSNNGAAIRAHVFSPSRVRESTRQDVFLALVVMDATRTQGRRLSALADYIAMVGLAQLDLDADVSGFPSVLNLFSPEGEALAGMTDWDLAYLRGLYEAPRDRVAARQEAAIARVIERDTAAPPPP